MRGARLASASRMPMGLTMLPQHLHPPHINKWVVVVVVVVG
jgi:hypothetical protein